MLPVVGLAFAHAACSASALEEGARLAPLAVVEAGGERTVSRFEAEAVDDALARGRQVMADLTTTGVDAWALAHESAWQTADVSGLEGPPSIEVLVVEFWARGMMDPGMMVQPFAPSGAQGEFRLIGDPLVIEGQGVLDPKRAAAFIAGIDAGVQSHAEAAQHWPTWRAMS